jgi:hypothetical protein
MSPGEQAAAASKMCGTISRQGSARPTHTPAG